MGKFDLNLNTGVRGNFWIRKEKVADSKIPEYVWTGPKSTNLVVVVVEVVVVVVVVVVVEVVVVVVQVVVVVVVW